MRLLLIVVSWVGLGFLCHLVIAQDVPPEVNVAKDVGAQFPKGPLNVQFVKLGTVDLEKGTLEYLLAKPVFETEVYTVRRPIVEPDGKTVLVEEIRTRTVTRYVMETRFVLLEGTTLSTPDGKKTPLKDVAKTMVLKDRDVILATAGEIEPYYLKFLAKDVLIIIPPVTKQPEPAAPVIAPPLPSEVPIVPPPPPAP